MDGHSSHFCPDTLALAHENGIMIFTLTLHISYNHWTKGFLDHSKRTGKGSVMTSRQVTQERSSTTIISAEYSARHGWNR